MRKHVIDNSCGDGAFLCEIVTRYCEQYKLANGNLEGVKQELECYIHGIELDPEAHKNCLFNLNMIAEKFDIVNVSWNVNLRDALTVMEYDNMMDFVVGNPPYVRVHNLENHYDSVKRYSFAQDGMTDLYLVFYELGLKMLNEHGKLCYITPSSWLSSLAASNMRKYILTNKTLSGLVDLGHYQAFEGITTYTMIALFENGKKSDKIAYYSYSPEKQEAVFVDNIAYEDILIDNNFYLASAAELLSLRDIKQGKYDKICYVKNGFATLADGIFILGVKFKEHTIPILKVSTGKWYEGFYPYDKEGKPLPREEIFSNKEIAEYLEQNKSVLLKGNDEEKNPFWYLYGRTQALRDVYVEKIAINIVIKDIKSIRLEKVESGKGLYSGLYILTKVPFETIESLVKSGDFINYLKCLKKYKSGGYYTYNSKDLEQYLNAKLTKYVQFRNENSNE